MSQTFHRSKCLIFTFSFSLAISSLTFVVSADAASTPKTITTCTNIKTKAMRLVAKGSCNKKTETTQIWIPKPSSIASPIPLTSNNPNTAKFNEFFSNFYLGKMAIGKMIGTDGFPTKTSTFTKGVDLFCTMLSIRKSIASGHVASAIYNATSKTVVQPKSLFGNLAVGGSGGCNSLDQGQGKYEDRLYIDDVLVAILPFEVK